MKDYYSILGVNRGAQQDEIKRAYRNLARRYHPDLNKGDSDAEARFKEISEAYEVLGDMERRRRYDLFGEAGRSSVFDGDFTDFTSPLGNIFDIFFGGPRQQRRAGPRRGRDLLMEEAVTLDEAYAGKVKILEIPHYSECEECGGIGLEKGFNLDICPQCGGEGRITHSRRSSFGTFTSSTTCGRCGGSGEINTHPCPACGGRGASRVVEEVEVNIPPGIKSGDRIRIAGMGEAGNRGGPTGDLYVEITVEEHPFFRRQGDDLHAEVRVGMVEAALGTEISLVTLDGEESLRIPPGSQPGEEFKLKGKGMPRINSRSRGDLYLTLRVGIPRKLSPEQKRLLEEYRLMDDQRKETTGLVERLRRAMRPKP